MPLIQVRNAQCHYQTQGAGDDVIVVHAATSNLSVWVFIGLLARLARHFRVTAYDLRGHGLSQATADGYTSQSLAQDLLALQQALDLGPAWLVGHSYGGVIAMHAAILAPQAVRGVILSDPYFPCLAEVEPNKDRNPVWDQLRTTVAASGIELGPTVNFTELFQVIAQLTPEQLGQIQRKMGPSSARWLAQLPRLAQTSCGQDMFQVAGLTIESLRGIRQPVVGLYDEHSPFGATCRWLRANLSDFQEERVPKAAHLAPLENPEGFVDLVERHLLRWKASATGEA